MSETKKSPSAQKKTTRSSDGLEKRKAELLKANAKRRHVISVVMFAVGLFIIALSFIGNSFAEKMSAWDHLHAFIYGLFGLTVFLVGPVIICIAVMISADMTRSTVAKRLLQLVLMILLLSAAAQVIFVGSIGDPAAENAGFGDTIGYVYEKGKALSGGGVAGLILGAPLLLFGQIGAIIILALVTFVAVMIIADKSLHDLFNAVKKPAEKIKDHHDRITEERGVIEEDLKQLEDDRLKQRREAREQRNAERIAKREEREQTA
ncbi:MAG: hypothetical protein IKP68_08215 [Clostridia bacterium]|nr:hypothetical protein [Clostridia bacterium]